MGQIEPDRVWRTLRRVHPNFAPGPGLSQVGPGLASGSFFFGTLTNGKETGHSLGFKKHSPLGFLFLEHRLHTGDGGHVNLGWATGRASRTELWDGPRAGKVHLGWASGRPSPFGTEDTSIWDGPPAERQEQRSPVASRCSRKVGKECSSGRPRNAKCETGSGTSKKKSEDPR